MRGMAEMFGIAGIVRGGEFSAATVGEDRPAIFIFLVFFLAVSDPPRPNGAIEGTSAGRPAR